MADVDKIDARPPFSALCGKDPADVFAGIPTPSYVIDEGALIRNGEILRSVADRTGCRILLAQKAFSNYDFYKTLSPFVSGTEASGLYEARLGYEEMPDREVHVFAAAYRGDEFDELLRYADHIVFNSISQLKKFGKLAVSCGKSVGLRVNPECSTQEGHAIYDPCAPGSRLGVTRGAWDREMERELLPLIDGLHFHTLCEQDADALERTLSAVYDKFGGILARGSIKWLNMGGGHHITRPGYNVELLERCILDASERFGVTVYLEPGEACALNAGYLVARVLDVVENGGVRTAILDASAACHMPDVIEMPYMPPIYGAEALADTDGDARGRHVYRIAGPTCLSGDVIGDYSFPHELARGDLLLFGDMAIYSTCKNNTFNGIRLPDIWKMSADGSLARLASFGYSDFKTRLGSRA